MSDTDNSSSSSSESEPESGESTDYDSDSSSDSATPRLLSKTGASRMKTFFAKNFTEGSTANTKPLDVTTLNAMSVLGMGSLAVKNASRSKYKKLMQKNRKAAVFEALEQPFDPDSYNPQTKKYKRCQFTFERLIDPNNVSGGVDDTYEKHHFENFTKMSKLLEIQKSVLSPFNALESTFLAASLVRLTAAFRISSNFQQFLSCNLAKDSFKNKELERDFHSANKAAMNSIFEELTEIAPLLESPKNRRSTNWDERLLKKHNIRLRNLPFFPLKSITGQQSSIEKYGFNSFIDIKTVREAEEKGALSLVKNVRKRKATFLKDRQTKKPFKSYSTSIPKFGKRRGSNKPNYSTRGRGSNRGKGRGRGRGRGGKKTATQKPKQ